MTSSQSSFKNLTFMISDVIDQIGGFNAAHGKRVAYMAYECIQKYDLADMDETDVIVAALLHDIGVSSINEGKHSRPIGDSQKLLHSQLGARRLNKLPFYKKYSIPVLYHHLPWNVLQRVPTISGSEKKLANLIHLADEADALLSDYLIDNPRDEPIHARSYVQEKIKAANGEFSDDLLKGFLCASAKDAFWFNLDDAIFPELLRSCPLIREIRLNISLLESVADILSGIIDAKSTYTACHSSSVGELSFFLAKQYGLSEDCCRRLRVAGYLHDIGKLSIPDTLLDKRGKLTPKETLTMHRHSLETYRILHKSSFFSDIDLWACHHHEYLDGSGYPFKLSEEQIPLENRILTVADIFQALAQDRPYRKAMVVADILDILNSMSCEGKLDARIIHCVEKEYVNCWRLARKGQKIEQTEHYLQAV